MDTIPSENSINTPRTTLIRGHFPLGYLGLGEFTPSKSNGVARLDVFIFNKARGEIVYQSQKKLRLLGVLTLTMTTKTPIVMDTIRDHIYMVLYLYLSP
jgi:hypothetical protein